MFALASPGIASPQAQVPVADLDKAARATIYASKTVWLIVREAKTVKPQLDSPGLPVEVIAAAPTQ